MGDEECNAQDAISFIIPSEVLSRGGVGVGWRLLLFQGLTERLNGPNLCVDEHRSLFNNTEAPGLS